MEEENGVWVDKKLVQPQVQEIIVGVVEHKLAADIYIEGLSVWSN